MLKKSYKKRKEKYKNYIKTKILSINRTMTQNTHLMKQNYGFKKIVIIY